MKDKCRDRNHAGNTTYTEDNYQKSTKPIHRNSVDVYRYENTKTPKNMKQTFIKGKIRQPPWNGH